MKVSFPIPEPRAVWQHFFDLVAVPRPSKDEGQAVDFIERWAEKLGYSSKRDKANNICVHVPATAPGSGVASDKSSIEPLLFQCHLDIVSVTSDRDSVGADASTGKIPMVRGDFDPENEKTLIVNDQGDWINSPYTTLGADNGIGVAMMMALAERPNRRVPLQLLFTTDEEAGMTGAFGLEPEVLGITSRRLINIDTEDDDEITIGAAGGKDALVTLAGLRVDANAEFVGESFVLLDVQIDGIKGGHSGIEINQGRANANRILARLLSTVSTATSVYVVNWRGGSRRNAIPDNSSVRIAIAKKAVESVRSLAQQFVEQSNSLYQNRDNPIRLQIQETQGDCCEVLCSESSLALVRLVQAIPTGICEMTPELPTLVESSCNLAIIELQADGVAKIQCSVRGTTGEALADVLQTIEAVAALAGGQVKVSDGYPGWKPDLNSALLKDAQSAYENLFGAPAKVHAVHAGLECGLLTEKLPGLEAISIGPTIKGNHAVGERVSISSVQKSYRFVEEILENLRN